MSTITKLAIGIAAAGTIFAATSIATATQAEARHGFYGRGYGIGFGYGRGIYGGRFGYGFGRFGYGYGRFGLYRPWGYGIYRPWAYRPWLYRPRVVVVPSSPCRIVLRPNVYGTLIPVRVCRTFY